VPETKSFIRFWKMFGRSFSETPDVRFRGQSGLPLRPGECLLMTRSGHGTHRHEMTEFLF